MECAQTEKTGAILRLHTYHPLIISSSDEFWLAPGPFEREREDRQFLRKSLAMNGLRMVEQRSFRVLATVLAMAALLWLPRNSVLADEKNGELDIYFIDVEGGAATLLVTPAGESILLDSGYPDYGGRDLNRIVRVVKEVAGRTRIDKAIVSHWHLDHYGNHAALVSKVPVTAFYDRGIPEDLAEDKGFPERIALYRAASQNKSTALSPGDKLLLKNAKSGQGAPQLTAEVITSSGKTIPNEGPANPFVSEHVAKPEDTSDNARSLSLLFKLGDFAFLTCGDLTWNTEHRLMSPNNPIGQVDLFMVTHHGLDVSNNPVLVKAIEPVATVTCNGPTKGGMLPVLKTLETVPTLKAQFQLHRNIKLGDDVQPPPHRIANSSDTADCKGHYIKASVSPDGKQFRIQVEGQQPEMFKTLLPK
ncbi:beta-lactamase domain protein [Planctopirus limnophila DSM 3776]|uniref:Beta-lactamase domain protein n=2 Tax=Planctopirus limnophila TaxID=120 RepID=D5SR02_PLAL2|nr:beta-lactamase domain protein [Planctopirus limnophila DSM 3776]